MREWRTSGSVGRAPGNRCLYPEADTGERGSCGVCATLYRSPVQVKRGVRLPARESKAGSAPSLDNHLHIIWNVSYALGWGLG
jgi:hypothetical protein